MSRIRDIANILSASTAMATDAEVASLYAPLSNPTFTAIGGDEGGQINLATAATNSTLSGPVNLDVWRNKVRLFEGGGNNRGASIDLSTLSNGVGSELVASAPQSGNTGKSLITNGTTAVWQENVVAGKNYLINGGFDVWQRGTTWTGTPTANTIFYATADRWFHVVGTGSFSATFERIAAESSDSTYGIKFGRNSGAGNNAAPSIIGQAIESLNAKRLAGKTVTLSFYAKTLSSFGNNMQVYLISGTGTDQSSQSIFGAGYTGSSIIFNPGQQISTTMSRYTFTGTVPANSNQLAVMFALYVTPATAGANEYVQMENIQLEVGNTATNFSRAAGNIQSELAACQRYYYRHSAAAANDGVCNFLNVGANGSTLAYGNYKFKTTMRTSPSLSASANTTFAMYGNGSNLGACTVTQERSSNDSSMVRGQVSSGMVSGYNYWIEAASNNTAYIEWSSEL